MRISPFLNTALMLLACAFAVSLAVGRLSSSERVKTPVKPRPQQVAGPKTPLPSDLPLFGRRKAPAQVTTPEGAKPLLTKAATIVSGIYKDTGQNFDPARVILDLKPAMNPLVVSSARTVSDVKLQNTLYLIDSQSSFNQTLLGMRTGTQTVTVLVPRKGALKFASY